MNRRIVFNPSFDITASLGVKTLRVLHEEITWKSDEMICIRKFSTFTEEDGGYEGERGNIKDTDQKASKTNNMIMCEQYGKK